MSSRIIGHYHQSFSRCGNVNNAFRPSSTVSVASLPSRPVTFRAHSRADQVDVGPAILLSLGAFAQGRQERWSGIVGCSRVPVRRTIEHAALHREPIRSGETVQEVKPPLPFAALRNSLGSDECEGARTEPWRFSDDAT